MAETTEILVVVLLTALAVVLGLFAYTGWIKFKRYQLRRSARY